MPQKDPVIYLRGVLAQEMKSILQFMYLGQATFYQDRMTEFINVAKSLEIKAISKDVDNGVPDSNGQEYDKNIEPHIGDFHKEKTIVNSNVNGEIEHKSSKVMSHRNEAGQIPCNRCDKLYTHRDSLNRHIKSAHLGIKYPCNDCGNEFMQRSDLSRHIKAIHNVWNV